MKQFPRFLASSAFLAVFSVAANSAPKAPPLAPSPEKAAPGLSLTFESPGAKAGDTRVARLVALDVPAGSPATPFLPPGKFHAKWEGKLEAELRDEVAFTAGGRGKFMLTINGAKVLEFSGTDEAAGTGRAKLNKGANTIVADYESPESGDAIVRLDWQPREKAREPIPPMVLSHDANAEALRAGMRLREGRELVAGLRCLKCHQSELSTAKNAVRDLAMDAPSLADAGARLNPDWMAAWISSPHAMRGEATMPQFFPPNANGGIDPRVWDIAAYLASLGSEGRDGSPSRPKGANSPSNTKSESDAGGRLGEVSLPDAVTDGGKLFGGLGCVACHAVPGVAKEDDGRVSLKLVKAKFQPAALQAFLLDPQKHYAWIRMPNFRLSADEASKLAAFLLAKTEEPPNASMPKTDVGNGKKLVESGGCANCHALPLMNRFKAPSLADILKTDWTRGCMGIDAAARGKAPDFSLTPEKRDALLAFAATDWVSLKQESLPELAERRITALRCAACHDRDGEQSAWQKHAGENAALVPDAPAPEGEAAPLNQPPFLPKLTWLGEKLRTDWARPFIAGKSAFKPRPWLFARMPGFPIYAEEIAGGLALEHGFPLLPPIEPAIDQALAEAGKKLVSPDGGLSCTLCHGLGDQAASQPFEAPAPNFSNVTTRLRKTYFHRWMLNPIQIDPDTKMTRFADENGKSPLEDFGGDATKQFEAIWQFLRSVEKR